MILGAYDLACLVTLFGLVAAIGACVLSVEGLIELALVSWIMAGLADLFDGPLARRQQRSAYQKEFGVQLDTVVDVVAFVVTPFVIGLRFGLRSPTALLLMLLFVICGVVRLAHFNTMSAQGQDLATHHRGLPVTYTALVFPILFIAKDFWPLSAFQLLLEAAFALLAVLFVIDVPIRKPRGVFYLLFPLLALALSVYWTWRFFVNRSLL
jgi:CDP-diacylglycerol--serine O-phosphatidyltransferase